MPQPKPAVAPKSASYVTVASKLPMNIEIQLCKETTAAVTGQFGSVKETVFVKAGPIHVIRGTGYPNGNQLPKGFPKRPAMAGGDDAGFALTPKVPADFWAAWLAQNKTTDIVRNGLIFAAPTLDEVEELAKERGTVHTGLEPLNPDGDPRAPRPLNASIQVVKTEERPTA